MQVISPSALAELQAHPLANLFPMIPDVETGGEFDELVQSVALNGVAQPIILHDGMILDGRNRRAAALAAFEKHGVETPVRARDWSSLPKAERCASPLDYVLVNNLSRRHLTASQRAIVAANVVTWERGMNQHSARGGERGDQDGSRGEPGASPTGKQARGEPGTSPAGTSKNGSAHVQPQPETVREVATRFSISERALHAAKRIRERGVEELDQAIRDGRVTVRAGAELLKLDDRAIRDALLKPEREIVAEAKAIRTRNMAYSREKRIEMAKRVAAKGTVTAGAMPSSAFPIVYADPPWQNEVWGEETGHDKSPENHYPTMPLADICALCVGDRSPATKDALLFLWRTGNRSVHGVEVARAWGFEPVAELVWDKVDIGPGKWVRDRHEVLMICRRGNALPLWENAPDSVYREKKGPHSVKPVHFAQLISDGWPGVPKIELFGRRDFLKPGDPRLDPANAWTLWGFEADSPDASRAAPPAAPAGPPAGRPANNHCWPAASSAAKRKAKVPATKAKRRTGRAK